MLAYLGFDADKETRGIPKIPSHMIQSAWGDKSGKSANDSVNNGYLRVGADLEP